MVIAPKHFPFVTKMGVKRSTTFLYLSLIVAWCYLYCEAVRVSSSEEISAITEEPTTFPELVLSDSETYQKEDSEPSGPIQEEVASLKKRVSLLLNVLMERSGDDAPVGAQTDVMVPESRPDGTSFPFQVILDECDNNPNLCQKGQCVNSADGYYCECDMGFESNEEGDRCVDLNECAQPDVYCIEGFCTNFIGEYRCDCPPGFNFNETDSRCYETVDCLQGDEFYGGEQLFLKNGESQEVGGPSCPGTCECRNGEVICAVPVCLPPDRCEEEPNPCQNAKCVSLDGLFWCQCEIGYIYEDGLGCIIDFDGCRYFIINCGYGECRNLPIGHTCDCYPGFEIADHSDVCTDIDECQQPDVYCVDGLCSNTIGSYRCFCGANFRLMSMDGLTRCSDIDECEHPDVYCVDGSCINFIGGYHCECPAGYTFDDTDARCHADCLNGDDSFYGMQFSLRHGESQRVGNTSCPGTCNCENGRISCVVPQCEAPDVCEETRNPCLNATCVKTVYSYYCGCDSGFIYKDGEGCIDFNECSLLNEIVCGNGECRNFPGGYTCDCDPGYVFEGHSGFCFDFDECQQPDVYCVNGLCYNTLGSYICECPVFHTFNQTDSTCYDFAEVGIPVPRDCTDLSSLENGVYTVSPYEGGNPTPVFCDFDAAHGPWTVIQRRQDGSVNFYRNMANYKIGFGNLWGEFWLGFKRIYNFVSHGSYQLRIDLQDRSGRRKFAIYDDFSISDESDGYRLSVGSYSGNARDSLTYHNGMQFTTLDVDNDLNTKKNCARFYKGAWWYKKCLRSNLNGRYRDPAKKHPDGLIWAFWRGYTESMTFVEMKIKRI